ncbi:hypothetical protein YC2023_108097 [Brassica napus]
MWLVVWFVGVGEIDRFQVPPDLGFMSNREEPSLKIGRLRRSNCSLEKRPQRRTGPKFPGKGRQRG